MNMLNMIEMLRGSRIEMEIPHVSGGLQCKAGTKAWYSTTLIAQHLNSIRILFRTSSELFSDYHSSVDN